MSGRGERRGMGPKANHAATGVSSAWDLGDTLKSMVQCNMCCELDGCTRRLTRCSGDCDRRLAGPSRRVISAQSPHNLRMLLYLTSRLRQGVLLTTAAKEALRDCSSPVSKEIPTFCVCSLHLRVAISGSTRSCESHAHETPGGIWMCAHPT